MVHEATKKLFQESKYFCHYFLFYLRWSETGYGLKPDDDEGDVDDDANDSAYVLTLVKATLVTGSAPLSSPPLHQIPFYLLTH